MADYIQFVKPRPILVGDYTKFPLECDVAYLEKEIQDITDELRDNSQNPYLRGRLIMLGRQKANLRRKHG